MYLAWGGGGGAEGGVRGAMESCVCVKLGRGVVHVCVFSWEGGSCVCVCMTVSCLIVSCLCTF